METEDHYVSLRHHITELKQTLRGYKLVINAARKAILKHNKLSHVHDETCQGLIAELRGHIEKREGTHGANISSIVPVSYVAPDPRVESRCRHGAKLSIVPRMSEARELGPIPHYSQELEIAANVSDPPIRRTGVEAGGIVFTPVRSG